MAASLFLLIGIFGAVRQYMLAQLPLRVLKKGDYFIITSVCVDSCGSSLQFAPGDTVLAIDEQPIADPLLIKKIADTNPAGTKISVTTIKNNRLVSSCAVLESKYKTYFIAITAVIAVLFYCIGIFVFFSKAEFTPARIFSWTCILIGTTLLIFWRNYPYNGHIAEYGLSAFYLLLYALVPGFILYFACTFPHKAAFLKQGYHAAASIFIPGITIAILLEIKYATFLSSLSLQDFTDYLETYNVYRAYFIASLVVTILTLARSYRHAATLNDKRKIQWILWAIILGMSPFLFLWTLLLALGINPVLSEFINYPFMLIVPVGIAISIVRYQAFDIRVIINKSIVYTFLTAFILITYLGITFLTSLATQSARPQPNNIITILFTLTVALFLMPLRERIQKFVDKAFFRAKYNYRVMRENFSTMLSQTCNSETLMDITLEKIIFLFQVDKILLMIPDPVTKKPLIHRQIGFSKKEQQFIQMDTTGRASPYKTGVYVTIPMFLDKNLTGLLLLGKKMSGLPYTEEDIHNIVPFLRDSLIALDRLRFQQAMIMEHAENKRLLEISSMKSEFIRHVSHELRTPLAAIDWSVSNLLRGIPEPVSPKVYTYLENVKESSIHLKRMIEDLLDITKIEAGKIEIAPRPLILLNEINYVLNMLTPVLTANNINARLDIEPGIMITADKTCLHRILINLIDNGIKFSRDSSCIDISASAGSNKPVKTCITNYGHTIPRDRINTVFDKFAQIENTREKQEGLGLGLYITKILIELHKGSISVFSQEDRTQFCFTLEPAT